MSEERPGVYRVLMSDGLFEQLGNANVDWGDPDEDGFYTPIVRTRRSAMTDPIRDALAAALRVIPPAESYEEWQAQTDRTYESDAERILASPAWPAVVAAIVAEHGEKSIRDFKGYPTTPTPLPDHPLPFSVDVGDAATD
jgi:hypothetical protein